MFGISFLTFRKSWLVLSMLLVLSFSVLATTPQAHAAVETHMHSVMSQQPLANQENSLVCSPTWIGGQLSQFRNSNSLQHLAAPSGCSTSFRWSPSIFQATGGNSDPNADATAQWEANIGSVPACTIQAFIPDIDAGADAQYYIWNGTSYLANTTINQENASGWTTIYSGGVTGNPRVTLDNVSPNPNKVGWDVAAYAVQFICQI
ncbi:MAG: hypothetical protein ACRDHZ_14780 [Ktedonobacteraceae bacterium]